VTRSRTDPGSPFSHQPIPRADEPPVRDGNPPEPEARVRVEKPWGHEEIFAVLEGRYVGKVLHIRAGAALSLQRHLLKDETLSVQSGRISVEHGPDRRNLERLTLGPGQQILVQARVVHRVSALVDSEVIEVSTAWPGWRTDVERLEDGYGRTGTTAP
jgi:mannose-6-phosphate isomerase